MTVKTGGDIGWIWHWQDWRPVQEVQQLITDWLSLCSVICVSPFWKLSSPCTLLTAEHQLSAVLYC